MEKGCCIEMNLTFLGIGYILLGFGLVREERIMDLKSMHQNFIMVLVTCELQCNLFLNFFVVFIPCTDNDKSVIITQQMDKSVIITQQMHVLSMYTVTLH